MILAQVRDPAVGGNVGLQSLATHLNVRPKTWAGAHVAELDAAATGDVLKALLDIVPATDVVTDPVTLSDLTGRDFLLHAPARGDALEPCSACVEAATGHAAGRQRRLGTPPRRDGPGRSMVCA